MRWLESVCGDVRYSCRALARRPGFAAVAVLTLAVGLGTMTVAFSAVNALFLAPSAFDREDGGLIVVSGDPPEQGGASFREFEAFARDVPALDVAAQTIVMLSHQRDGAAGIAWGLAVTDNYFDVAGAAAAIGRTLTATDDTAVVVSERFWRERLGAASLTGLSLRLNGADVPVIGVLPKAFRAGFYDAQVWVRIRDWEALRLPPRSRRADAFTLTLVGRLRPGATHEQARHQVRLAGLALAAVWPAGSAGRTAAYVPFAEGLPELRAVAVVAGAAMAMIGIVLAIAVFNVAGLLLARAVERGHEMSLRGALGASRRRLMQQLVTESLVIAALGGALALLVARWSHQLLASFAPEAPIPQRLEVTPDWRVAAFTVLLVVACGVAAGLLPARRATRLGVAAALSPPTITRATGVGRARETLVALQLAGATLLVTLAALLVRQTVLSAARDLGFERERLVVLELDPASHGYDERATERFVVDVVDRIRALPGVVSAAVADRVPFYVGFPQRVQVSVDGAACANGTCPSVGSYRVGPAYFRTMNIALRRGGERSDGSESAQVAVVSETLARRFWPAEDPVGEWLTLAGDGRRFHIIGVAADVTHRSTGETPEPYVYLPFEASTFAQPVAIVARTSGDPGPLLPLVAARVRAIDPAVPIYRLRTMRQRLEAREQAGASIVVRFFAICGGLGLFLAVVGLAGSMAYAVGQRTRELGIRTAIGARPADLARLVAGSALRMAAPGVVLGLAAARLLTWGLRSTVSGVDVDSPVTFLAVGVLLMGVAMAAAAIPCRRAAYGDPIAALRVE